MPTYEFKCKKCERVFAFDTNEVDAYHCEQPLVRVWSPAGVQFKGSGFHKNDYGGK